MYKKNMMLVPVQPYAAYLTGAQCAENSQDFGDYVVHFNALNTSHLPPGATREYDIKRSKNRGMINIAVLNKIMGTAGKPVAAEFSARPAT